MKAGSACAAAVIAGWVATVMATGVAPVPARAGQQGEDVEEQGRKRVSKGRLRAAEVAAGRKHTRKASEPVAAGDCAAAVPERQSQARITVRDVVPGTNTGM